MTSETSSPTISEMVARLCDCGSGRAPGKCHDLPKPRSLALRAELHALAEAHLVAAFFPGLRPSPEAVEAYVLPVVRQIGSREDVHDELHAAIEQALARMGPEERLAPSRAWRERYPDRWQSVVRAVRGDEAAVERCFAASTLRAAILERLPFDHGLADELDGFPPSMSLSTALSLVIHPGVVWDRDDAALALDAFPRFRDDAFEVADRYAPTIVTPEHLVRVRQQIGIVSAALPLPGREAASRLLERAVREVSGDADHETHLACMLLQGYASMVWHQTVRPGGREGAARRSS